MSNIDRPFVCDFDWLGLTYLRSQVWLSLGCSSNLEIFCFDIEIRGVKLILLLIFAGDVCSLHHDFSLLCRNLLLLDWKLIVDWCILIDNLVGVIVLADFAIHGSACWLIVVVLCRLVREWITLRHSYFSKICASASILYHTSA